MHLPQRSRTAERTLAQRNVDSGSAKLGLSADAAAPTIAEMRLGHAFSRVGVQRPGNASRAPVLGKTPLRLQRQPSGETRESSIDPSGSPEPTSSRVLDTFDVDRGPGRRPWNLDRLTIDIGTALKRSPTAMVEIWAYYDSTADLRMRSIGEARKAALKRAQTVRSALIQWVPVPANRITVQTMDRSILPPGDAPKRQIMIVLTPHAGAAPAAPEAAATPGASGAAAGESTLGKDVAAKMKEFFGEGVKVDVKGQNISVSITGVKTELKRWTGGKVEGKIGLTGSVQLLTHVGNWHFVAEVTPYSGEWRVSLSYPRESWVPDATRIKTVMSKGIDAIDSMAAAGLDPKTMEALNAGDFEALKNKFKPHVDPVKHAIEAATGVAEAVGAEQEAKKAGKKGPRVSAGLEFGSGWGPGAPSPEGVKKPEGPEGFHARGVITITF
jgi:hypothetical protein